MQKDRFSPWIRCLILAATATNAGAGFALTLEIEGWSALDTLSLSGKPPIWLGDDPIAGRLACPPLSRLEGSSLINAPVLLKSLPVIESTTNGEKWTYTLRPGLKWWNGSNIDGEALAGWLRETLPTLAQEKLGVSLTILPTITAAGPHTATIQWKGSSPFGPFIFSGVSLSRASSKGFECAGLYALKSGTGSLEMTLNSGYKAKFAKMIVQQAPAKHDPANAKISFKMASDFIKASSTTMSISSCPVKMDVPLVTSIVWNPALPLTENPSLRQALTHITPRGDLLRTGAGELGQLVSAPILRIHPGYDPKNLVRPYSLQAGGQILEQHGYTQAHIGLPRAKSPDKPATIHIGRLSGKQGLIEKVVGDSYASSGIEVAFEDIGHTASGLDGVLVSTFLPWTSMDFRQIMKAPFPFAPVSDKQLSDLADAYAKSLTELKPDSGILKKIHGRWMDVEPWTMLMSHQYCVAGEGLKVPARINIFDSDWFRHIAVD